jgi:hypothetical protein
MIGSVFNYQMDPTEQAAFNGSGVKNPTCGSYDRLSLIRWDTSTDYTPLYGEVAWIRPRRDRNLHMPITFGAKDFTGTEASMRLFRLRDILHCDKTRHGCWSRAYSTSTSSASPAGRL